MWSLIHPSFGLRVSGYGVMVCVVSPDSLDSRILVHTRTRTSSTTVYVSLLASPGQHRGAFVHNRIEQDRVYKIGCVMRAMIGMRYTMVFPHRNKIDRVQRLDDDGESSCCLLPVACCLLPGDDGSVHSMFSVQCSLLYAQRRCARRWRGYKIAHGRCGNA